MAVLQRGRVSASARSMIATGTMAALKDVARPEPLEGLSDEEAKVWRTVVDSLPPDWFPPSTYHLLGAYCRHTAGLAFIDQVMRKIEKSKDPDMIQWRLMSAQRLMESKSIDMLATKMRISQQATTPTRTAHTKKKHAARMAAAEEVKRPWA